MSPVSYDRLRRGSRSRLAERIRVCWEDDRGNPFEIKGRCVDISETGVAFLVEEPLPLRSYVQCEIASMRFKASGSIRFAYRKGLKHLIGLEFSGGQHWNPETHPIPEV
mgnify:CR=1 FL=1